MEHHHHTPASLLISIFSAIFAWVSIQQAQIFLGFLASLVALCSGVMAIRYYYYATKKLKKENLEKLKP